MSMSESPEKNVPLYRSLAVKLENEFAGLSVGSRVPSAQIIAERESVSYETAVKAMDILKRRGIIERRRGSGSFIAGTKKHYGDVYFALPFAGVFSSTPVLPLQSIYRGVQLAAQQAGVPLLNFIGIHSNFNYDVDKDAIAALPPLSSVIVDSYMHPMFPFLQKRKLQVVLLDDCSEEQVFYQQYMDGFHQICFDRMDLMRHAVRMLYNKGRRNILLLTDTSPYFSPWRVGYRNALSEFGIPYRPELEMTIAPRTNSTFREVRTLLLLREQCFFDAVLCVVYTHAVGAYQAIRSVGMHVPRDIAILSLMDNEILSDNPVPISFVGFDYCNAGIKAFNNVVDFANSPIREAAEIITKERNSL